jgi:hypothetical protein
VGDILTAEQLAERWQVKVQSVYAKTPRDPLPGRYDRYRRLDVIEEFEKSNHNTKEVA